MLCAGPMEDACFPYQTNKFIISWTFCVTTANGENILKPICELYTLDVWCQDKIPTISLWSSSRSVFDHGPLHNMEFFSIRKWNSEDDCRRTWVIYSTMKYTKLSWVSFAEAMFSN